MLPCEVNLLALFSKLFKTCIRRFFSDEDFVDARAVHVHDFEREAVPFQFLSRDGNVGQLVEASVDAGSYTQEDGSIQIDLSEGDTVEVEDEDWAVIGIGGEEVVDGVMTINKDGEVEVDINDVNEASGESQE